MKRYRYDTGSVIDQETGAILSERKAVNMLNKQDKCIKELEERIERLKRRDKRREKDIRKYTDYFMNELNWDCDRIIEEVFR